VKSRFGTFVLGFATGALTIVAYRRYKECEQEVGYERLADSVQRHLAELEARIGKAEPAAERSRSKSRKS
jgi:hypothetical protein